MLAAIFNSDQQSWVTYLIVFGTLTGIAVVILLLGKLFPSKAHTAAGNALMHAETFFNPSREHVIEATLADGNEEVDSGDRPIPGSPHGPESK